jgi:hypothetical protein
MAAFIPLSSRGVKRRGDHWMVMLSLFARHDNVILSSAFELAKFYFYPFVDGCEVEAGFFDGLFGDLILRFFRKHVSCSGFFVIIDGAVAFLLEREED